jgi:hypothetical protein
MENKLEQKGMPVGVVSGVPLELPATYSQILQRLWPCGTEQG